MTTVALVDSGGANIASLQFALQRLHADAVLTSDPDTIQAAERVILPGVGAAADAMRRLENHALTDTIRRLTQPVLGICLGMQLLLERSEEDDTDCLGIVGGAASKLQQGPKFPVPNMGWCAIEKRKESPLLDGIPSGSYFYFLHSYALPVGDYTMASARHEREFTAVLSHGNFHATQFHPERSSTAGASLLRNFLRLPH